MTYHEDAGRRYGKEITARRFTAPLPTRHGDCPACGHAGTLVDLGGGPTVVEHDNRSRDHDCVEMAARRAYAALLDKARDQYETLFDVDKLREQIGADFDAALDDRWHRAVAGIVTTPPVEPPPVTWDDIKALAGTWPAPPAPGSSLRPQTTVYADIVKAANLVDADDTYQADWQPYAESAAYTAAANQVRQLDALFAALPEGHRLCVHDDIDTEPFDAHDYWSNTTQRLIVRQKAHGLAPGVECPATALGRRTVYGPKPAP